MSELVSPGVSITITDESFYAAAGTGTVPLLIIATAQDKAAPDGSGLAQFTTSAEASKVKLMTSQRDLLTSYGNPIFKSLGGTPLHGHELNEYGLQAAYSFLGIANRAYVLRADINLSELEASTTPPTGVVGDGAYWLDTAQSVIGLKVFDNGIWVRQSVLIPTTSQLDGELPKPSFSTNGSFAVVYWNDAGTTLDEIKIYEKVSGTWHHVGSAGWDTATGGKDFKIEPHTALSSTQSGGGGGSINGDVLLQITAPNNGTDLKVRVYSATSDQFTLESTVGKETSDEAYVAYDSQGGVSTGDLWIDYSSDVATIVVKRHNGNQTLKAQSLTAIADDAIAAAPHTANTIAFTITVNNADAIEVSFDGADVGATGNISVDEMVAAINSSISDANDVTTNSSDLTVDNVNGKITIVSQSGYDIIISDDVLTVDDIGFTNGVAYSNWEDLSFEASATEITGDLADGTLWYDSLINNNNIDILRNSDGNWITYEFDVNIAASEPTTRSDGTALQGNEIWISSSDLENYPKMYIRRGADWVELDTTDGTSIGGVIFADFRSDITSSTMDDDAPQASLYPYDMIAWNKRASGGNVKKWKATDQLWEDYSGNKADGSPAMLRKAQRRAIVRQMQAAINSNTDIRNEINRFNLIACPGYPELLDEMITLNVDRKETAFIVTDAPLRLNASATDTQAWATNSNNAIENGEDGLVSKYAYSAVFYPSGLTSGLDGNNIVVPSSHIALRTLAFSDQVSYPWFAPAGFQRGVVTNATSVGYINAASGEFVSVQLSEGQRDGLYINKINPIGQFPGRGIAIFGQKTLSPTSSALDRVNVARLVVYVRERLDDIVRPFLFEPNDEITRANAKVTVDRFLAGLVSQRGLFDFLVVCDSSNNTPARIDRNELWIDVAIQPVKSVEFIYIPVRIQNTLGVTG